jgi:hypothetical protein
MTSSDGSDESDTVSDDEESLLAQARAYLDDHKVNVHARIDFFRLLEAILTDDDVNEFVIPEKLIPIWRDVLELIGQHLFETPARIPETADHKISTLIDLSHVSPQKSFAERVSTSPVRQRTEPSVTQELSQDIESEPPPPENIEPPPPAQYEVIMTESEYEFLRNALAQKQETQSKSVIVSIPSGSSSTPEEIPADSQLDTSVVTQLDTSVVTQLDTSAITRASSSDFRVDGSAPLSGTEV